MGPAAAPSPQLVELPVGEHTLPIYMDGGPLPSSSDVCSSGSGDEICGIQFRLKSTGSVTFQGFVPNGDLSFRLESSALHVAGGNYATGNLGPTKLGELTIDALAPGFVNLATAEMIGANLQSTKLAAAPSVSVPEPGFLVSITAGIALLVGEKFPVPEIRDLRPETGSLQTARTAI